MIIEVLLPAILLIALIIGSVTDMKIREVPDQLNYLLIVLGLGIRSIMALIESDVSIILSGVAGFGVMFAIAMFLFYTGQWGGGDAKLLMGMGAIIGLEFLLTTFMVGFLINLILVGAIFGLFFSFYLVSKHKKDFKLAWKNNPAKKFQVFVWLVGLFPIFVGLFFFEALILFAMFSILIIGSYYLLIFMKVVEGVCMIKEIPVSRLTEGDWIVNEVIIKGKRICGPSDLGILDKQIELLKKLKVKSIIIKEGIPFVPSFLIAYVVTFIFGSWFVDFIAGVL